MDIIEFLKEVKYVIIIVLCVIYVWIKIVKNNKNKRVYFCNYDM